MRGWCALLLLAVLGACGDGSRSAPPADGSIATWDSAGPGDASRPYDGARRDATGTGMCGATSPCNIIDQDCPRPGEGCYAVADGETVVTRCIGTGARAAGADCMYVNDCGPGLTCNAGRCSSYCCAGDSTLCASGEFCTPYVETPDVGVCMASAACSLVPQGGCASGEACYVASQEGALHCARAGAVAEGQPCGGTNPCAPGLGCYGRELPDGGAPTSRCVRYCRLGMDPGDCAEADRCISLLGSPLPDGVGVCTPR